MAIEVPDRLRDLIGFSSSCSCGRTHSVDLKGAVVRSGALEEVVPWAREVGNHLKVRVVVDRVTREVAGERVKQLLQKDGQAVSLCVVPDGAGGRPHADEKGLDLVEAALNDVDLAVSVGAGTINDLTKLASFRQGIPYLSVATAPSMNGYTSAIAAVMIKGIKLTVACHQPYAVLADLDVLEKAPPALIAAGLGDLESKPTATADFRLSGRIRGTYYCPAPERVILQAEARVAESAQGLRHRDPEALALLTEALLLSGISMKLAGASSPASGGEHLISHYWDMTAPDDHRVEGWHGAQVGVATIVTASLYDRLREIRVDDIDVDALIMSYPSKLEMTARIKKLFGRRAPEVTEEFFKKHLSRDAQRKELEAICADWHGIWEYLGEVLRPAEQIRSILSSAGAPVTMDELGLTPHHLQEGFLAARVIRGRYTVLDFAANLGLLASLRDRVLAASGCL